MAKTQIITINDVKHVASLARLQIDPAKLILVQKQLEDSLEYVKTVQTQDLKDVPETVQISGLTNIFRKDVIDEKRMLSQEQALSNAPRAHKGYFLVKAVIEE